jgi:peptidoglycan/xylan/chitin deacetylase (PgdA/CDA1 family)
MPGRFTRPALAFSALALLASLAPAEGSAEDAPGEHAPQAYAPGAGPAERVAAGPGDGSAGGPDSRDARAYTRGSWSGEGDGVGDGRGDDGESAHGVEGVTGPARRPETRELQRGHGDGAEHALVDGDRLAPPAGGAGEAGRRPVAAHPGEHRVGEHRVGERRAGEHRAAGKPASAPGLALSAAFGPAARKRARTTADTLTAHAERIERRLAAYREWGLEEPLPARPAPPELKPRVRGAKVLRRVPTDDRVVFLTIDDGAMKSQKFLEMIHDLDIPVTSFLADEEAELGPGYDYFRTLEILGGTTQNHTLHHRYLPALSYRGQRREICGQQDRIQEETGGPQPRLFRPPYGEYDGNTLRAARACGLDAVVLWGVEAWADRIDFAGPGRELYPGAIILTHYRGPAAWGDGGTMVDMLRRVLELAAEEGYAIGRLEDYL